MPRATIQMQAKWTRLGSRSQPKTHSPRNVDSRKKAARPSMASGPPKTSPTKREYADQFMPNSNSCTRPVTTPMATLISSKVPKKRVNRRISGSPERCQMVCMMATKKASPIVTGTKRKWYTVVEANCARDRSTVSIEEPPFLYRFFPPGRIRAPTAWRKARR